MSDPVTAADLEVFRAEVAQLRTAVEKTLRGVTLLVVHLGALPKAAAANGAGRIAPDSEIDDPEGGDKEIRKDPPRWKGDSFKGRKWSETSPEYLDAMANFLDWTAGKKREEAAAASGEDAATKLKYAGYDEADAAKVRAWAKRLRERPPSEEV